MLHFCSLALVQSATRKLAGASLGTHATNREPGRRALAAKLPPTVTKTARQFIEGVTRGIWSDCPEPWNNTATMGLSDFDREVVDGLAAQNGDDPDIAAAEIVQAAKEHERATR